MAVDADGKEAAVSREIAGLGELAVAALARRDAAYFATQVRRPYTLAWTVLVSLAGLYGFDWSPASIWVFLLVGLWGGLLQNGLKLALFRTAVNRYYATYADDQQVWAVVSALRHGRHQRKVEAVERSWTPLGLFLMDLGMLGVSTAMMLFIADQRELALFREFTDNRALLNLTALTLAAQVIPPLWMDRSPGHGFGPTVQFDGGGATLAGWVLMFLFAGIAEDASGLHWAVLAVNGLVALGIPLAALAVSATREETRWLADRLADIEAGDPGPD